jgi:hypothetical protein
MEESSHEQVGPVEPEDVGASLADERIADNEIVARRINESIEEGRVSRDGAAGFVCECGQLGCNAIVELTLGEYEQVRARPRRFLVVDGHGAGFDTVIDRRERYAIVAKLGAAGRKAEATDPRAGDG